MKRESKQWGKNKILIQTLAASIVLLKLEEEWTANLDCSATEGCHINEIVLGIQHNIMCQFSKLFSNRL